MLPGPDAPGAALPVRPALGPAVTAARQRGAAVLVAPPGSGKTSLLPLALADAVDGRIVVAEPRRVATRAAARRLAALLGEPLGERVGYAVRGERVGGAGMRIEVVTTGLLVRRLQHDPELPGVAALVLDECHERQLDADLALAFAAEVRAALRDDLALVATSATPDTAALTRALGDVPVVTAEGVLHDVRVEWHPPPLPTPLRADARVDPAFLDHVAAVTRDAVHHDHGDVLVFVPGEAEVRGVASRLAGTAEVFPLYGRQSREEQDRALTPTGRRRVVVTTAVAESSLTVPGVRVVVDSGLARQPRTDPARGLAALVTVRASRAAADQRAGRAGREAPGVVHRCWSADEHRHRDAHTAPEIATADLTEFALTVAAWGAPGGRGLALPDPPPEAALEAATELLQGLGALGPDGAITSRGRSMAELGVQPRLARALLDGAVLVGDEPAREVVALLDEDTLGGPGGIDDLPARWRALRQGRDRAAAARWREGVRRLRRSGTTAAAAAPGEDPAAPLPDDLAAGTVVGLAFPDRIARRRRTGGLAYLLANGTGATLAAGSGLREAEWLAVAVADRPVGRADARILAAAPVDEATVRAVAAEQIGAAEQLRWDAGRLIARRVESLGSIELSAAPLRDPEPAAVAAAIAAGLRPEGLDELPWTDAARTLRLRLAFCHAWLGRPWPEVDDAALLARIDDWLGPDLLRVRPARGLGGVDLVAALRRLLPWPEAARLDELAPERLQVPSGSRVRVGYDGGEPPVVAVKLQETFGWTATPALADGRAPVVLHLLSPAGRQVAITSDLASFWQQGYPQVRAELRARYPKHPWPEDPLTAAPTARTTRRR